MAYTRVNWLDSPSTATPLDAANLNVMDIGISNAYVQGAGTLVNADIASGAAIAKAKLASLDIVNADVDSAAAISVSKLAITNSMSHITSDVTMTSANTFYDGPSVSCVAGTWFLASSITLNPAQADQFTAKLWDGTTSFDATQVYTPTANAPLCIRLVAIVSPAVTTTYKISVAAQSTANTIKATPPSNSTGLTNLASGVVAIRIG